MQQLIDCMAMLWRLWDAAWFVRYVADSPPHEHGGFYPGVTAAAQRLLRRPWEVPHA